MKVGDNKESFTVVADTELHKAILAARKAGRRYGGKLVSCTMAFELGVTVLLGREEKEETVIKQDIEDLKTQKAVLEQKERMMLEQLHIMEASREAKMLDAAEQNDNVQMLAQKIIDVWDTIIIDRNRTIVESLVDVDRKRLTRMRVEAIFPRKYRDKPSIDEAIKIAIDLLEGESIGA
ncbi:MAG: hypothetical protein WCR04_11225 [Fibrobacteraceae bacterium]